MLTVYLTQVLLQLPLSHNRPQGKAGGSGTFWRLTLLMKPGWSAGPLGFLWQSHPHATLLESWTYEGPHACYQAPAGSSMDSPRAKPLLEMRNVRNEPSQFLLPWDWLWSKQQRFPLVYLETFGSPLELKIQIGRFKQYLATQLEFVLTDSPAFCWRLNKQKRLQCDQIIFRHAM